MNLSYNGALLRVPVLPPAVRLPVLHVSMQSLLTAAHLGRERAYHRVCMHITGGGMDQYIKMFVNACSHCQARKTTQPPSDGLVQLFSATELFLPTYTKLIPGAARERQTHADQVRKKRKEKKQGMIPPTVMHIAGGTFLASVITVQYIASSH